MTIGTRTFQVELITPEWSLPPTECTFVALPGWDGEFGVLSGRSPLICALSPGELRLEIGGAIQRYYVQAGFAEVVGNTVSVIAERAIPGEQLKLAPAERELEEARELKALDAAARQRKQTRIAQARAKLIVARRQAHLRPGERD